MSAGAPPRRGARALALLRRARRALRSILGAPDYERYLAHVARHHPGRAPLSRAAFERECAEGRAKPGARCC